MNVLIISGADWLVVTRHSFTAPTELYLVSRHPMDADIVEKRITFVNEVCA
jgi:hypothetical protein